MKYKKGVIFFFLLLCFLSIAGVCANDAGDVNIQTGNGTVEDVVALDVNSQENDDAVASDDESGQDMAANNGENNEISASFIDLQSIIDDAHENEEIYLLDNYSLANGGNPIGISKNITINGMYNTLDGAHLNRLIIINKNEISVTLKAIKFVNGKSQNKAGAILNEYYSTSLTLIDCEFNNNYADSDGGAVYSDGNLLIVDSKLQNNEAGGSGGAIYCTGELNVTNSDLDDNRAGNQYFNPKFGGAIYSKDKCYIDSSRFHRNFANSGGAIYSLGDIKITGPNTFKNHDSAHGVINAQNGANIDINWNSRNADDRCEISFGSEEYRGAIVCDGGSVYARYLDCYDISVTNGGDVGAAISVARYKEDKFGELHVSNSKFKMCSYTTTKAFPESANDQGNGGTLFSWGKCYVESCQFYDSHAIRGGAIYSKGDLTISGMENVFSGLVAYPSFSFPEYTGRAGAVYCEGNLIVRNATFKNNKVSGDGGAIYCEGKTTVYNSKFENNLASNYDDLVYFPLFHYGGAICSKGSLTLAGCEFDKNHAGQYGGAVYTDGEIVINDCNFTNNDADYCGAVYSYTISKPITGSRFIGNSANGIEVGFGGAIYISKYNSNLELISCRFENNTCGKDGGAIYIDYTQLSTSESCLKLSNCTFIGHSAEIGGAIYCPGETQMSDCTFNSNTAKWIGGAVYSRGEVTITGSSFADNSVTEKYLDSYGYGGAIYASKITNDVTNSVFLRNNALSYGGALYINNKCDLAFVSCRFESNKCKESGGAIYLDSSNTHLKVSSCNFTDNVADVDGGAIYAPGDVTVSGSIFDGNRATGNAGSESWGGAIRSKGLISIDKSSFNDNFAHDWGGAVYTGHEVRITNSDFTNNHANSAGAVYAGTIDKAVSYSLFINNNATAKNGDGGALYINDKCNPEFYSCRFEGNNADNRGGAIYLDSKHAELKVSYCTFVDNHAYKKDYSHHWLRCGAGHSIFNKGYYNKNYLMDMCWFGLNKTDFNEQFVEKHESADDEDHIPKNYLKITMMLNETDIYVGNTYKVTINFISTQGSKLKKDLLHSLGRFYGEGQFSNVKADINDMTADVTFDKTGKGPIFGRLDKQVLVLNDFIVKDKPQSEVHILSCENVEFPDQLKVTYEIINMSADGASYVVKNSDGVIVTQGDIKEPSGEIKFVYDGITHSLTPGSYSITITNPETRNILGSSANATYTISKGRFGLRIVVFNETYPDEVECIVYADVMLGLMYNLTVTGDWGVVYSSLVPITNRVGHFDIGVLDAGHYTATIFCIEKDIYDNVMNHTAFEVSRRGTSFEVEISAGEITYGETATVIPILSPGATGNITYHLNDGTFLDKLAYNETLTLPILDAGSYVIIANYSGDIDDLPAVDSVHLLVNKVKTVFEVAADPINYGENAIVTHALSPGATGNITYYLADGTVLGKLAAGENLTLPIWDAGSYVIYANYSGDTNFINATANATLTINMAKTAFNVEVNPINYGESATVTHMLPANATGTIRYYLSNGTFIDELAFDENLTLISWDAGTYDIVANYSGDRNFINATANVTLTINRAKTEMMADPVIVMYNSNGNLLVILKDMYGDPVRGVNLTADLNGAKNYTTDKDGQILISTDNLRVGTYNVTVSFNGTNNYMNCSNTTVVTVTKMVDTMTVNPLVTVYQVHKYLVINLKDELNRPIVNENVIITVNGVSYKCKTDANGNARLIIRLDARVYTAKVTFVNDNYETAIKYVKVTVLKATPKIAAKKKTFKAKKKIKRYKVKLTVHSKALAKVKVTLKIKGKTYKARTNAKGVALFKIQKLTKKGKYKAEITYKGNYLYNKVTKKVKIRIK